MTGWGAPHRQRRIDRDDSGAQPTGAADSGSHTGSAEMDSFGCYAPPLNHKLSGIGGLPAEARSKAQSVNSTSPAAKRIVGSPAKGPGKTKDSTTPNAGTNCIICVAKKCEGRRSPAVIRQPVTIILGAACSGGGPPNRLMVDPMRKAVRRVRTAPPNKPTTTPIWTGAGQ